MKTKRIETFSISKDDVEAFEKACKELYPNVEFLGYENYEAKVSYSYPHQLFYLGRIMSIKLQLSKI